MAYDAPMKPVHRMSVRVRSYETDTHGRLQVPILCKLLQEAATLHAAELGVSVESLIDEGCSWVLSRMHLVMERWPTVDDQIVIETWPEALNRLTTERRFEIRDGDGRICGTAMTLWLVLDLDRRKPIRVPERIVEALAKHDVGNQPVRPAKLPSPDPVDVEAVFTVRRSDLDLADHVNNTSYVEWAIEAVPDEVWASQELAELQISFLSECHQGQTIVSVSQTTGDARGSEVRHQLVRREDGEPAALARTVWRSTG
jgi:acyl-ACP thioesterase